MAPAAEKTLSPAAARALRSLMDNGGEGAITTGGILVARGERLYGTAPETWLRLMTTGHLEPAGAFRVRLTGKGSAAALPKSRKGLMRP